MKRTAIALLFAIPTLLQGAAEDRITLSDDGSLSGVVSSIDSEGRVKIQSPNTVGEIPLKLRAIKKLVFDTSDAPKSDYAEIITLRNGDHLPGDLSALDDTTVSIKTRYANTLTVPRTETSSIDFGVRPQELVFSGPGKIHEWTSNDNWEGAGKTITNNGTGVITREDILPAQFILRFRMEWEGNPSLRFYFCDDLLKTSGATDRYRFDFTSTGMQIERQSAEKSNRWDTLAKIPRTPNTFAESLANIELRVDRDQGLIYLYINGEPAGHHRDHIAKLPTGSGIMLESRAGGDMKNIVSRIEIYEWDTISQLRSDEGHEDKASDSLISSAGERFSGTAEKLIAREDGSHGMMFASPHTDESFIIPKDRISTLYFRVLETPAESTPSDCTVFLINTGQLKLSQIRLDADHLIGVHPLLGDLSINRGTVARIEFSFDSTAEQSKKTSTP